MHAASIVCLSLMAAGFGKATKPEPLSFKEFFDTSPRELKPTARLLELNGKRVRMVGYMAQMEKRIEGAFYLVPHPVVCDEEGAGTSNLPVENVFVVVRSHQGKEIAFIPGPLEVTGILEVGNRAEEDGRVSAVRLTLDRRGPKAKSVKAISKTTSTKKG